MNYLKVLRFRVLFKSLGIHLPLWSTVKVYFASQAFTLFPGGEAGRSFLLKNELKIPLKKSVAPVLLQAYLELLAPAVLALLGSFIFFQSFIIPSLILTGVLIGTFLGYINDPALAFIVKFSKRWPRIYDRLHHLEFAQEDLKKLVFDKKKRPTKSFISACLYSFVASLGGGLLIWLSLIAFHTKLSFGKSLFVYANSVVVQFVGGISPGGLGFTEGAMFGMLSVFGVTLSTALGVIVIYRLVTMVYYLIVSGIFWLLFFTKIKHFSNKLIKLQL